MATKFSPKPKERGNVILAQDWNTAMGEIVRLGGDSLTVAGGTITGNLIANGTLGIGTGTAAPTAKLEVNGDIKTDRAFIGNVGHSGWAGFAHKDSGTTGNYALLQDGTGATLLNAASGKDLQFRINNAAKVTLDKDGNVGIGDTTPEHPLHVTTAKANDWQARFQHGRTNVYLSHAGGYGMHINTGGNNRRDRYALEVRNASQPHLYVRDDGNVGIGVTQPEQTLDVNGRIHVNNGVIQRGGTAISNTSDLGLYSRVSASWMRFVTNKGRTVFYSDDGKGNTPNLTIEADGNVGIGTGTAAPNAKLEVNGTVKATKFVGDGSGLTGVDAISSKGGTITGNLTVAAAGADANLTVSGTVNAARFQGDGSALTGLNVLSSKGGAITGNLTIGAAAANAHLEVNGAVKATSFEGDGSKLTGIAAASASPWTDLPNAAGEKGIQYKAGKTVTIGAANAGANLHILNKNQEPGGGDSLVLGKTDASSTSLRLGYHTRYAWIQSHNNPLLINGHGGNVGIGTKEPKSALDVAGYIVMQKPAADNASAVLTGLLNNSLIISGPAGDQLVFYWKDGTGKTYGLKLKGAPV
ncbi:MAG: hypothetical protein ACR2RB_04225 [Gammaproteobacteria bacterium]